MATPFHGTCHFVACQPTLRVQTCWSGASSHTSARPPTTPAPARGPLGWVPPLALPACAPQSAVLARWPPPAPRHSTCASNESGGRGASPGFCFACVRWFVHPSACLFVCGCVPACLLVLRLRACLLVCLCVHASAPGHKLSSGYAQLNSLGRIPLRAAPF
eukprot:360665-Chlamydomonas_euryale.AAC.2